MYIATSWLDDTRKALSNRPRSVTLERIADDTGLSLHWLRQFSVGRTEDPGVCKVETLYNYLNKQSN